MVGNYRRRFALKAKSKSGRRKLSVVELVRCVARCVLSRAVARTRRQVEVSRAWPTLSGHPQPQPPLHSPLHPTRSFSGEPQPPLALLLLASLLKVF